MILITAKSPAVTLVIPKPTSQVSAVKIKIRAGATAAVAKPGSESGKKMAQFLNIGVKNEAGCLKVIKM